MNSQEQTSQEKTMKHKIPDAITLRVDPNSKGINIKIPFIEKLEGEAVYASKYVEVTEEVKLKKMTMTNTRTGEVTVWYEE